MVDLYSEILKFEESSIDKNKLIEQYVSSILEPLDYDTLLEFTHDAMSENLSKYTVKEILDEIKNYNPDLAKEFDVL
jgi:hypothetical protein